MWQSGACAAGGACRRQEAGQTAGAGSVPRAEGRGMAQDVAGGHAACHRGNRAWPDVESSGLGPVLLHQPDSGIVPPCGCAGSRPAGRFARGWQGAAPALAACPQRTEKGRHPGEGRHHGQHGSRCVSEDRPAPACLPRLRVFSVLRPVVSQKNAVFRSRLAGRRGAAASRSVFF